MAAPRRTRAQAHVFDGTITVAGRQQLHIVKVRHAGQVPGLVVVGQPQQPRPICGDIFCFHA
jgi:hypothetical protein